MKYQKRELIAIAKKIETDNKISSADVATLLSFQKQSGEQKSVLLLKRSAIPLSLLFGFLFTVFPADFERLVSSMPPWTNLPQGILSGVDYLWDILGEPVGKANFLYHIPNIILYSFGILGIKKLLEALDKKSWLDSVLNSQKKLKTQIDQGTVNLSLKKGHSLLFVGNGDFIGMQFALNNPDSNTVTISETKPPYTSIWNYSK